MVASGSLVAWWGLLLFALAGFSMWGATPAEVVASQRKRAALLIAPAALLLCSAIASIWGARVKGEPNGNRNTALIIVGAILAAPLALWLGLAFNAPIVGLVIAALALGALILDGRMDEKRDALPAEPPADANRSPDRSD